MVLREKKYVQTCQTEVAETLQPIVALYENVGGATQRSKGMDGKVHEPAVSVSRCFFGVSFSTQCFTNLTFVCHMISSRTR